MALKYLLYFVTICSYDWIHKCTCENLEGFAPVSHGIEGPKYNLNNNQYLHQNNRRSFIPVSYDSTNRANFAFGSPISPVQSLLEDIFDVDGTYQHVRNRPRLRRDDNSDEMGRLLSPSAFDKISETLGALNTVGRYIVNMTRGGQDPSSNIVSSEIDGTTESVPDAILTLTKNVLGQNVEKSIEPLIKGVGNNEMFHQKLPSKDTDEKMKKRKHQQQLQPQQQTQISKKEDKIVESVSSKVEEIQEKDSQNRCRTPDGKPGRCDDLSSCPTLLLDLTHLRESLCFKSLFVPGVCCAFEETTILTTQKPLKLTTRPPYITSQNLILKPQNQPLTTSTTVRPVPAFTIPDIDTNGLENVEDSGDGSFIDPDDCGQQEYSSGRIVGGIEAPNGQWPWMAAIFLHGPKRTEFWCGGSLIGTKYVLTAAHCTRDSKQRPFAARQFTVRLGDIDLSTDKEPSAPVTFRVTEVRAHPEFSRVGFYNDLAILVLEKPVRKSKYVIPVCLPNPVQTSKERLSGRRATVVGWGTTYYGGKESTSQRQASLPIWRNEDCNRAYFQPITDNFLCAGYSEGGVDACQGDSGGPLMMQVETRWTQLGIVSFGNKCGEPGYPGVYTRVSAYINWIRENTLN